MIAPPLHRPPPGPAGDVGADNGERLPGFSASISACRRCNWASGFSPGRRRALLAGGDLHGL